MKETKLMTISDDVTKLSSGVGTQAKYLFEGLKEKYNYNLVMFGGGFTKMPPDNMRSREVIDDKTTLLTRFDAYGNPMILRSYLDIEKPDCLFFITDPRFYYYLWNMENEIHSRNIPLAYWHVWDNDPPPLYNWAFYRSTDVIGCISKLTYRITKSVLEGEKQCGATRMFSQFAETQEELDNRIKYIPHALPPNLFYPYELEKRKSLRKNTIENFECRNPDKEPFIFFWNNRNATRKRIGGLLETFKELLMINGYKDKVFLILHSNPTDEVGQNLYSLIDYLGLQDNVFLSAEKISTEDVVNYYNISDCTLNIASSEGFGLSSLEAQMCGCAVINNKTGGLQEQVLVKDSKCLISPAARLLNGGGETPYIYDDIADTKQLLKSMQLIVEEKEQNPDKFLDKWLKNSKKIAKVYNYDKMIDDWHLLIQYAIANKEKFYDSYRIRVINK